METLQRANQPSTPESSKIEAKQLLTLIVCCLAISVIVIDFTIVINGLPSIQATFSGVSVKDLEWITSLYGLIFGSFLLTWGKLGDEFGRKSILMAGIAIFVLGSVIDGLSANLSQMLVGRSIQGFGGAMASPSTLSILSTTFTGKARSVAFGMWGAVAGAAGIIGPLMGGYFTTYVTWRWSFLINVPLGAVTLIVALYAIKESRFSDPKYSTDYLGVTLVTLGLASLLFGSMILMDSSVPELQLSLRFILPIVFGLAGIVAFLVRLAVASQRRQPVTGVASMIGEFGYALTSIEPGRAGRVATHGEIWRAIAREPIAEGDRLRITGVDGLTVTVRKE